MCRTRSLIRCEIVKVESACGGTAELKESCWPPSLRPDGATCRDCEVFLCSVSILSIVGELDSEFTSIFPVGVLLVLVDASTILGDI